MNKYPIVLVLGFNLVAFFVMIIAKLTIIKKYGSIDKQSQDIIILEKNYNVGYDDVVPEMLLQNNTQVVEYCNKKFGFLTDEAKKYIRAALKRYPISFMFQYFVYKELVAHSYFLVSYNPKVTVVYTNEANVACPIITEMYNRTGREFISFMHGEYFMDIHRAFMRFTKYYVWDESYKKMLTEDMRCLFDECVVYTPLKYQLEKINNSIIPEYKYTYYVGNETLEEIREILKILMEICSNNEKCRIRPHPRHSDINKINSIACGVVVEDYHKVSIYESFESTEYVIGLSSTVLIEAFYKGVKVAVNDVTNPKYFRNLEERGLRIINMCSTKLSDLLKDKGVDINEN